MSASEDRATRLPEAAEALLAEWPEPERDAEFWQKAEQQLSAKLKEVEPGSTPSELLAAPLPASDQDGTLEAAAAQAPPGGASAPRRAPQRSEPPSAPPASLAEIARQAVAQAREPADSKDIARESLSLASRARASTPELAATLAAARTSPNSVRTGKPQVAAAPVPVPARSSRRGVLIGAGVALLAAVAGAVFVLQARRNTMATFWLGESTPASAVPSASAVAPAQPRASAEVRALSPNQLPKHATAARGIEPGARPESTRVAKKSEKTPAAPASHRTEPRSKAGSSQGQMRPASGATNGRPDHPSLGAVQAAVGAVLGSARACVAGDDQPSHAVLMFGSNGHVRSVTVSGPAAGTPAAGCIRAALRNARVEPFARSSYSVGTPIRPQ